MSRKASTGSGYIGGQKYSAFERSIPADFSSATFPLCAAAITGSEVLIAGLDFNDHQGDKAVFTYFENMGIRMKNTPRGVLVSGGPMHGIDIDMNATPDALPAMAVAACFAIGHHPAPECSSGPPEGM